MANISIQHPTELGLIKPQTKLNSSVKAPAQENEKIDFEATLKEFIQRVNQAQKSAQTEAARFVQNKEDNLVEALVSLNEARLNFQLMVEIRNKLLQAYQEIQHMPV